MNVVQSAIKDAVAADACESVEAVGIGRAGRSRRS